MRMWGTAVAGGHVVLGVIGTFVLEVPGAELFFGLCALATLALAFATAPLLRPRDDEDPPSPPRPPDDDPEPPWWPDFERQLRAWADERRGTPA
jgi:hypothetical protein